MTDHDESRPAESYAGPPPTEQFPAPQQYPTAQYQQPQYQQPQYQQPQNQPPYQQPAYPQPYGQFPPAYGYPPAPPAYGYGYPPFSAGPKRPGLILASAVLGYINAGLLILAGALLLFGAAIVSGIEDAADSGTDYGTEVAIDGLVNFLAAGLLIAGAVMFTGRRPVGRILLSVGNGIVLASAVYWLVRFNDSRFDNASDSYIVWAVVFATLAILPLAFSFVGDVNRWLNGEDRPA